MLKSTIKLEIDNLCDTKRPTDDSSIIAFHSITEMLADSKWVFGSTVPYAENTWARGFPSPYYNDSHRRLRTAMREWVDQVCAQIALP